MDKTYNHKDVEERLYRFWEEEKLFEPEVNAAGKPFCIILPPPNVTGSLHIGHALTLTIEDILIRYHRMLGDKTLWLPGTDHAAIATQSKVESILYKKEGKTRFDLGREKFLKLVEDYAQKSHDTIVYQIRRMGASVDWKREAYTLDEPRNLAVRTAFKQMYDMGLIYRGNTIVNWDPKLKTTVSDDEIEWKEEISSFYYLQYGPFVIGTARPETKFGDKYIVMHPSDKRYKEYKNGQKIDVEWINGKITATVVKDEAVDMSFGTGVMTITPWHDRTDFDIATRHNLDKEQIIDFDGKLLPIAGEFAGMHIKKARPLIVEKLKEKGLLVKTDENYKHRIATNYRGGGIIEPQIMPQWMIGVNSKFEIRNSKLKGIKDGEEVTLKKLMKHVVESGQIKIVPDYFVKTYYHWIDNLRDWCISRQIWYGHQIPVWYKGDDIYVGIESPKGEGWEQDPDTLDTWFSSGLWTFSTLGWPFDFGHSAELSRSPQGKPKPGTDLATFHPTSVMETGYDILFFWVARMILMTTALLGQIPFHKVLLHGLVRDAEKEKMSKSKGNVIDPLDMIEKYGTDALRIALIFSTAAGSDIPLSEDKIRGMKFFSNKLWNIGRFIELNKQERLHSSHPELVSGSFEEMLKPIRQAQGPEYIEGRVQHDNDKKIVGQLETLIKEVTKDIEEFRLHEAAQALYQFTWHEFADKYIEGVKNRLDENSYSILLNSYVMLLKLLHPFMPFVTEELWQKLALSEAEGLPHEGKSIMIASWPVVRSKRRD